MTITDEPPFTVEAPGAHSKPDLTPKSAQNRLSHKIPSDFGNYTAYGSFAPLYTDAKRNIWDCYDTTEAKQTLLVLDALAQHANQYGSMYRLSWRVLMRSAHMRFQAVKDSVLRLVYELDYLREHRTWMATRNQELVDWQLNPRVLWIAQPSIADAERMWALAKVPNVSVWETQPESDNQNQKTRTREPDGNQTQTRSGKYGEVRSRWVETPIENCKEALSDGAAETWAKTTARAMDTGLSQARQMILTYGKDKVIEQMELVKRQMSKKRIAKPGAMLVTYLRTAYGKEAE